MNTALRASDLLRITVGQVEDLEVGGSFAIREKKTKKVRKVFLNEASYAVIQSYLSICPETGATAPLFLSRIGKNRAITVSYLNNLMKR
ncbi:MAG: tyrosine-type recombinase/integrase [Oligoflexales bacterium]